MVAYQQGYKLDALGDPTRRAIFERLSNGPLAVVEIAKTLPVSRPAVSQHLKVLKDAGLVMDRAQGTRRVYQLDPKGLEALRTYFDRFWSDALDAFRRAAEESFAEEQRQQAREREQEQQQEQNKKKKLEKK